MASGSTSHSCPFTGSAPYKSSHVASDPSAFLQGSVQQLIIHPDPRTPEEMCEAEESSVSPPHFSLSPPQWALKPQQPEKGLGPRQFFTPNVMESLKSLILASAASGPILSFLASSLFLRTSAMSLVYGDGLVEGSSVSSKVLGSSVAVPVNGLVSRLPAKKGCQDSKIKVKNSKTF